MLTARTRGQMGEQGADEALLVLDRAARVLRHRPDVVLRQEVREDLVVPAELVVDRVPEPEQDPRRVVDRSTLHAQ